MKVPISGQVTGQPEADNVMAVAASSHYGGGQWTTRFERGIASYMGRRFALFTNSGSSSLLCALAALELPKGSKVLTCAVNFPTTVNVIVQLGHIPVFIDADPKTLNAAFIRVEDVGNGYGELVEDFYEGHDIAAAVFAHTLGNPLDIPQVDYPIIEDCCDAIGSKINGEMVGGRGVFATASFYPAHHITTGEGGAVFTDNPRLHRLAEQYRTWGRDCWCEPGHDNKCGRRYGGDYDHKYTYSKIGYNLKASDFQAAVGVAQLERLEGFGIARRYNWNYLRDGLQDLPIDIIDMPPGASPFGFAFLTDRRNELARYLDSKEIGNRPVMAGNLTRQPAYKDVEYEVIGNLTGANLIHTSGLWIGCFPGITREMMDYTIKVFHDFFK